MNNHCSCSTSAYQQSLFWPHQCLSTIIVLAPPIFWWGQDNHFSNATHVYDNNFSCPTKYEAKYHWAYALICQQLLWPDGDNHAVFVIYSNIVSDICIKLLMSCYYCMFSMTLLASVTSKMYTIICQHFHERSQPTIANGFIHYTW